MPPKIETYPFRRAYEGIIRRNSLLPAPVMLKGSYLTRQYCSSLEMRIPEDLDFVHLQPAADVSEMHGLLNDWVEAISIVSCADGITNMKGIAGKLLDPHEYFMDEDFPTLRTFFSCEVDGQSLLGLQVDMSFNLNLRAAPAPCVYQTVDGGELYLRRTCPIGIQVAWKLHQLLVWPDASAAYDLIHLLAHPQFDVAARELCIVTLRDECQVDGSDPLLLADALDEEWQALITLDVSANLRFKIPDHPNYVYFGMWYYHQFAPVGDKPVPTARELLDALSAAMRKAGLGSDDLRRLLG